MVSDLFNVCWKEMCKSFETSNVFYQRENKCKNWSDCDLVPLFEEKSVSCCTSWLDSDRPMEKLSLKYGLTHENRAVHDGKSDVASGHLLHKTFNKHEYIHNKWTNNILDF